MAKRQVRLDINSTFTSTIVQGYLAENCGIEEAGCYIRERVSGHSKNISPLCPPVFRNNLTWSICIL